MNETWTFLNKVLFWALTKSHRLLKRYQPIDSRENLRMLSFLLFNMRTVSQFQSPRLDIYQSNCQHHCGLLFILSASWQPFWFTQHWKVSGEAYILSIPLSNSWQIDLYIQTKLKQLHTFKGLKKYYIRFTRFCGACLHGTWLKGRMHDPVGLLPLIYVSGANYALCNLNQTSCLNLTF